MSSWRELYDDFKDQTASYIEKLTITEKQFMRYISKALSSFQKDTALMEELRIVERAKDSNGTALSWFIPPYNLEVMTDVKDQSGASLLIRDYEQFAYYLNTGSLMEPHNLSKEYDYMPRLVTMFSRQIMITPDLGDERLYMRYIPNLDAYSSRSPMWASWFPEDQNFNISFNETGVPLDMLVWESAILDKAIADLLKRKVVGSPEDSNVPVYKIFEASYFSSVGKCIQDKPTLFRGGVRNYHNGPWS